MQTIGDIVALVTEALGGGLRREAAETRWSSVPKNESLARVREDLLDALDHIPVDGAGITIEADWQRTPEFDDLHFYIRQLERLDPNESIE